MKKWWWFIIVGLIAAVVALFKLPPNDFGNQQPIKQQGIWGVTYSKKFATEIGLDWQTSYTAILDDLGVKKIRLPLYWDEIETSPDDYNFTDYDWLINEAAKQQVELIITVGRRVPRWPECHTPDWIGQRDDINARKSLLAFIKTAVERYRQQPAIIAWQVENEPLLDSFGVCPPADYGFLRQEVELVASLDKRPILLTASGELSNWRREAELGDWFGTTVYRTVWSPTLGYIHYPWPPTLYSAKAATVRLKPEQRILAELQAEPWAPNTTLDKLPESESAKSFTTDRFLSNLLYAERIGFNRVYLWGVEWWYWQKENGDRRYWDIAKKIPW